MSDSGSFGVSPSQIIAAVDDGRVIHITLIDKDPRLDLVAVGELHRLQNAHVETLLWRVRVESLIGIELGEQFLASGQLEHLTMHESRVRIQYQRRIRAEIIESSR